MTKNQIDYVSHLENVRHNKATEDETHRNNVAVLQETNRHNVVNERETHYKNMYDRLETERHNRATEKISMRNVEVMEEHYQRQDSETKRSNLAKEDIQRIVQEEVERSNRANENIGYYNVSTSLYNAQTSRLDLDNKKTQARASLAQSEAALTNASTNIINAQSNMRRVDVQNAADMINANAYQNRTIHEVRKMESEIQLNKEKQRSEIVGRQVDYINATSNIMNASSRVIGTIGSLLQKGNLVLAQ